MKLLLDLKNNKLRMTTTHFILEIKYVKVLIDLDNPFTFLWNQKNFSPHQIENCLKFTLGTNINEKGHF